MKKVYKPKPKDFMLANEVEQLIFKVDSEDNYLAIHNFDNKFKSPIMTLEAKTIIWLANKMLKAADFLQKN